MDSFLEKFTFLNSVNFKEFKVKYSESEMLTFCMEEMCNKINFNLARMGEEKSMNDEEDTSIICDEEDCVTKLVLGMIFIHKDLYVQCSKVCESIETNEPTLNYLSNKLKKFAGMKSNEDDVAAIFDDLNLYNGEEISGLISLCEAYLYRIASKDEYSKALPCLIKALDFPISLNFKCFTHYLCAFLHSGSLLHRSNNISVDLSKCRKHVNAIENSSYQNDILRVHAKVVEVHAISHFFRIERDDRAMKKEMIMLLEVLEKELLTVHVSAGVYTRLGRIYRVSCFDNKKALHFLQKSIEMYPTSLAFHQTAIIYDKQGDIDKAIDAMKKCLTFSKRPLGNCDFYSTLAYLYLKKGYNEKCLYFCENALIDESLSFISNEKSTIFHRTNTMLSMKSALEKLGRQYEGKMVCMKLIEQNCLQFKAKIPLTTFIQDLRSQGRRFDDRDYFNIIKLFRMMERMSNFSFSKLNEHFIVETISQFSQLNNPDICDVYLLLLPLFITDNNIQLPMKSVSALLLKVSRQFLHYKQSFCMATLHILMNFLDFSSQCTDKVDLKMFSICDRKYDLQVCLNENFYEQKWMMDFVNTLKFKYGMRLKVVQGESNLVDENCITVIFASHDEQKQFFETLKMKKSLVIFDKTEYKSDENKLYMTSKQSIEEAFEKMMEFLVDGGLIHVGKYTEDHQRCNDIRALLTHEFELLKEWSNGTFETFSENVLKEFPPKREIKLGLTKTKKMKLTHLICVYHPDKNRESGEKWLLLTEEITKHLCRFL